MLGVHVYHPGNDDGTVTSSEEEAATQTAPMVRSSSIRENDPLVGVPDNVKEIISVSHTHYLVPSVLPGDYYRTCKKCSTVQRPS